MHFTWEDVKDVREGEVFILHGKRHRLDKKTKTAIVVSRWYWFDSVAQWLGRRLGCPD